MGCLRGKHLGIHSSVMEANASLRALVNRNTAEEYWDYETSGRYAGH
jgi:hypothetical protein